MESYRHQIDLIDDQIIALLGRRFQLVKKIGEYKNSHKISIVDANREALIQSRLAALANDNNLDPAMCTQIYTLLFQYSRNRQLSTPAKLHSKP